MNFQGSVVAIVTPFSDGRIDKDSFKNLVEFNISNKTTAIVVAGTTGESPTLSHLEHNELVDDAIRFIDGRIPLIAGAGSNSTAEAIDLSKAAKASGAAATLVVNPYYNRPTQEGLLKHYLAIADSVDIPMIVYNIPGRTAGKIELDTMIKLADHDNIIGLKDATGNLAEASLLLAARPDFQLFAGDDLLTIPIIAIGGSGVVSVAANLVPDKMAELTNLALAGDFQNANLKLGMIANLLQSMTLEVNPIPIKTALAKVGLISDEFRLPLSPMATSNRTLLFDAMRQLSLIK